jgi:heme exporter protein C
MYVHVPTVYLAYLAFVVTAISSAGYLWARTRSLTWDRIAGASAEIGVFFMAIALVSGSLWGSITWGTYWVWDARLTTTAFLFVTYIGYLAVRRLGGSHDARARRSGIMALFAVLEVPLVHFSVDWWRPLHQTETVSKGEIDGLMLFSLFIGIVTFTLFYVWLLLHRQRVLYLEDVMDDRGLELAIAERRREGDA